MKKGKLTFKKWGRRFAYITLFFLALAFIATLSFWVVGYKDQSAILEDPSGYLFSDQKAHNHLGRFGAYIAHILVERGFGIAAPLLPILIGLFLARRISLIKQDKWKFEPHLLFWLWILPLIGVWIERSGLTELPFAGLIGRTLYSWLEGFIGVVGVPIMIFLALGIYVYVSGAHNAIARIIRKLKKQKDKSDASSSPEEQSLQSEHYADDNHQTDDLERNSNQETKQNSEDFTIVINDPEKNDESSNGSPLEDLEIKTHKEEVKITGTLQPVHHPRTLLPNYQFPPLELLKERPDNVAIDREELEQNKQRIVEVLKSFKIEISKIQATVGPTVTLYEIVPAPGIRISKIKQLEEDLALSLEALGVRIIAPMPGRGTIGIEVPNKHRRIVGMREVLGSKTFRNFKGDLPIILGKTIANEVYIADLAKMPHLLIAGATGQGKSVMINAILASLLYRLHPADLKLVLVDPKKVELSLYEGLQNHFIAMIPDQDEPIITETDKVIYTLNALCIEMDQRYDLLKDAHVRNVKEYNQKYLNGELDPSMHRYLPFIVLVIDEYADFIMTAGKEVEHPILRLAQKARAVGIHLIIATQRPAANIITGNIKANFPARIAFKVPQQIDSRTILDMKGAERLVGRGDLLFAQGSDIIRLQAPLIETDEVEQVVSFIERQEGFPKPYLLPEYEEPSAQKETKIKKLDPLLKDVALWLIDQEYASATSIQRAFSIGFPRAAKIIDQLEVAGIVGKARGSKPREILVRNPDEVAQLLHQLQTSET